MPSAELHDLTLAEAAHLISARKLSPAEYTESLLARTEALEPQLNAFITRTPDVAMAAAARRRGRDHARQLARAAARHSVRRQGYLRHGRHPDVWPFAHLHRPHPRQGRDHRRPPEGRRGRADGQARDARVRARRAVVRPAMAAGAQSLEHSALHRRLVVGLGRRARCPPGAGEPRLRHRRFDPRPGWPVRHRRTQTHLRPCQPRRRVAELLLLRSLRAHGADVARLRPAAECDCRPRSGRPGFVLAAGRGLRQRYRWRRQGHCGSASSDTSGRRICVSAPSWQLRSSRRWRSCASLGPSPRT